MALIKCEECGNDISNKTNLCIHCGMPINDKNDNTVLGEYTYSLFRAGPFWFCLFVLTSWDIASLALLIGWAIFMFPRPKLIVFGSYFTYRDMNLKESHIYFDDIVEITVGRSLFQRAIGAGWIIVDRKGFFNLPVLMNGLSDPKSIRELILKNTN